MTRPPAGSSMTAFGVAPLRPWNLRWSDNQYCAAQRVFPGMHNIPPFVEAKAVGVRTQRVLVTVSVVSLLV